MALTGATQQKNRLCLTLVTFSLLLSLCAQVYGSSKIYQVEIIVFERSSSALGSGEGWQKNIQLEYPVKWQSLFDPAEETRTQEIPPANSDEFLQALAQEREQSQEAVLPNTAPGYFTYLPAEKRGLQNTRDALARRNLYRILFHETWIQPMEAIEKARPLILHGGRQYGEYYELQGTVTVGLSRFLHVQTDLWLSEFSTDANQDSAYGIQLPREPQDITGQEGYNQTTESAEPYGEFSESAYLVNQVTVLRQKRRMRSGEVHYLDHPRLGALIKITPQQ